jgi:hypothetical protein
MPKELTADELLAALNDEFNRGQIYEGMIPKGKHEFVMGICESALGPIVIDSRSVVVELLLHELLHRRFWKWGERRVQRKAETLLASMSHDDIRRWHRKFKRVARRRVIEVED